MWGNPLPPPQKKISLLHDFVVKCDLFLFFLQKGGRAPRFILPNSCKTSLACPKFGNHDQSSNIYLPVLTSPHPDCWCTTKGNHIFYFFFIAVRYNKINNVIVSFTSEWISLWVIMPLHGTLITLPTLKTGAGEKRIK